MGIRIENLTDKPLWLRLNSGESLVIPARARSRAVADHELKDNPPFTKLAERRIVRSVSEAAALAPDPAHGEKVKVRRGGEAHS
jgi:hypothetical protein